MRTSNPTLNDRVFDRARQYAVAGSETMTVAGAINKTGLLLMIVMALAYWSWNQSLQTVGSGYGTLETMFVPTPYMWVGMIGGFIFALVTIFKSVWAPYTTPVYAACQGLFLGAISAGFEVAYPGIVTQAILGTFGTLLALLMAYRSGMIKVTEKFRAGIVAATAGIFFIYLISFVMSFFGSSIPMIHQSGALGVGFSLVVVGIAAMNLVLDFDFFEKGEARAAPKHMEWYAAFGLLVTLVWLYLEILRLLAKLKDRR